MVFWISWQSFFNTITQNLRRIFWVFVRVKKSNTWIPIALPIETRWLFFLACFNLYPDPWGFMIQFDAFFFLNGLVQPPTTNEAMLFEVWGSYRRKKSCFFAVITCTLKYPKKTTCLNFLSMCLYGHFNVVWSSCGFCWIQHVVWISVFQF